MSYAAIVICINIFVVKERKIEERKEAGKGKKGKKGNTKNKRIDGRLKSNEGKERGK